MSERFNAKKEIEDLAVMTNNGFNTMFDLHNEQAVRVEMLTSDIDLLKHDVVELKRDVAELRYDMSIVKTSIIQINQKLDLILDNMVTKQEFQSLVQRTERLELA